MAIGIGSSYDEPEAPFSLKLVVGDAEVPDAFQKLSGQQVDLKQIHGLMRLLSRGMLTTRRKVHLVWVIDAENYTITVCSIDRPL